MHVLAGNAGDILLDIVLSPALWLCILFGVVYGILFTLWRGGGFRQLLRDIAVAVLGFGLGQVLASFLHLPTVRVGEVHLLWGSLFAVLALLVGRRYWRRRPAPKASATPPAPGAAR
jgi:hypothetical protein